MPKWLSASARVVFVDFSLKHDAMIELAEHVASVTVYDHHVTAEAELAPLLADGTISGVFAMEYSGARLACLAFNPSTVPLLVRYIEDRDLWRHAMPDTREINAALSSYEQTFENWSSLARALSSDTLGVIAEGSAILRSHNQAVRALAATARPMMIGGHVVPVVNCPKFHSSEVGHVLCGKPFVTPGHVVWGNSMPEYAASVATPPFAATYFDYPDRREFSLRSTDAQEDVSEIAKALGGGGHRNASGFRIPLECASIFGLIS